MRGRDIIVIGGSAGAIEAARTVLSLLPANLPAAIFIVIHTAPDSPGFLDTIFARSSDLAVGYAVDNEPIRHGRVYVAPGNRHLILERERVRLTSGPRENRFRPAVDPLFRTAAAVHGPRVIGIVLSGNQDDGAVGLGWIKKRGGIAVVQDPHEAAAAGMPQAALQHVRADHVVRMQEIAAVVQRLTSEPLPAESARAMVNDTELRDVSETGTDNIHRPDVFQPISPFTCPDCGGSLRQFFERHLLRFQCHVGHRFSGEALATAQGEGIEHALWTGLRALEESAELRRRMAAHARARGQQTTAARYEQHAAETEQRADMIRRLLMPREEPESMGHSPASIGVGDERLP